MACGNLQNFIQDLSTNLCFVSYFEILAISLTAVAICSGPAAGLLRRNIQIGTMSRRSEGDAPTPAPRSRILNGGHAASRGSQEPPLPRLRSSEEPLSKEAPR